MAEKVLNTRILMKVDTLENWGNSSLKLKKGELAFATVAASAGTGLEEPVVMVKIGTEEEKTFAELPWSFYAKASDVLTACKSEDGLRAFVNGVIADAGIASSSAMEALAGRVTTAEGEIDTLQSEMDAVEAKASANETAIGVLNGLVGSEKVADQIASAIAALNLDATYDAHGAAAQALADAKTYADGKDTAMNARVEALEAIDHDHENKAELDLIATGDKAKWDAMEQNAKDYADGLDDAMNDRVAALEDKFTGEDSVAAQIEAAVNVEKDRAEQAEAGLQSAIDAINNADSGILKQAKDYADGKDATIQAAQDAADAAQGDVDDLAAKVGDIAENKTVVQMIADAQTAATYDDTKVKEDIATNAAAIALLNNNAETAGSVDYKIAQAVAGIMENPDDTMNSINELVTWTNEHAQDALEMSNQVTANKNDIATLKGDANTAGSVAKQIADAVAVEKDRAEDAEGGLDTRLQAVEAAVGADGAVDQKIAKAIEDANLDQYATDTELSALDGRVVAVENELNTATTGLKARMDAAESDIDALEAKVDTGDQKVSEYVAAAIAALSIGDYAKAADLTAAIEQHNTDKAALEGAIALKANDADLAAIAKTGNVNDLIQTEGDVLVFDCGTSV